MRRVVLAMAFLVAAVAHAGTFTILAPRNFTRGTGAPVTARAAFPARNTALDYTLRLENGGATSAVVTLNGTELLGPRDFHANTPAVIERTVRLAATNELAVEVRGNPGTRVTISILGADNDQPTITAALSPPPNAAGWNKTSPVTVTFTCSDATSSVTNCPPPEIVNGFEEAVAIGRSITDAAGNSASIVVPVRIDTNHPIVELEPLVARTNGARIHVAGIAGDGIGLDAFLVAGAPVTIVDGEFESDVALSEGRNRIEIVAMDKAGNATIVAAEVERYVIPVVRIAAPVDLAVLRDAGATVSGSVTPANASVTVNGVTATVAGGNFTAANVPLAQGRTVITATATTAAGASAATSILVYRDSIPPRVVVHSPAAGATVYQQAIDVAGMVDDIVVGTVNSGQARVVVNGVTAEVSNRAFVARNVPLAAGANTLIIVATDQGGNSASTPLRVTYDAAAQPKIVAAGGNNQSAVIGTALGAPLSVRLVNANGTPAVNRSVSFEVAENNGTLTIGPTTGRSVATLTDSNGQASATWTLGTRAGAGNNRVISRATGFAGTVEFLAAARLGPAHLLVVDSGNQQFAAIGSPLPRPLVAVVVDRGSNRVAGVPVTFAVGEGEGSFGGAPSITVNTDSDGRAIATPTLGAIGRNVFHANTPGIEASTTFFAYGKVAGPPAETRISGVILDNTDLPIPGVTIRIDGSTTAVQSNDAGQFTISGAPVGYVKLLVDGSTTRRPGTWPTLEYAMYTIPGANNTLEMPIYLLPIDTARGLFVDEITGGTLTLPELPGFALTVKPGSATFPGGSRTGTVSVTVVHADKMPMAPGFGQQPRFIVTIQPPGVHFDPPAAISFPNVDGLAPGEITEMYSFDHDLGQFVSIGTGSVSANGAVLASDPGVGIIKGGWHCGGNPPPGGTPHCCDPCLKCDNNQCVIDHSQDGSNCEGKPTPDIVVQYPLGMGTSHVTIHIDASCLKMCTGDPSKPCATKDPRWGYDNLAAAAQTAVTNLTSGGCLGPTTQGAVRTDFDDKFITIKCVDSPTSPQGTPACGYADLNGRVVTLTNRATQNDCSAGLAKTIGHELLHAAVGINHAYLPVPPGSPPGTQPQRDCANDTIYPCDQACFNMSNACPNSGVPCP